MGLNPGCVIPKMLQMVPVHTAYLAWRSALYEPPHEKTNNLHMRKQRRRSASR